MNKLIERVMTNAQERTENSWLIDGKFCKMVREYHSIPQKQVSLGVHTSVDTLSKFERGLPVSRAGLVRYAYHQFLKGYGIPLGLFDEESEKVQLQLEDSYITLNMVASTLDQINMEQVASNNLSLVAASKQLREKAERIKEVFHGISDLLEPNYEKDAA